MNDWPFVSVIIVNYNGAHFLPTCLDALHSQTYPADRFEVIVSDNGSSDGSIELLENHYPWVKIVKNSQNLGFAAGNNVAMQQAHGDYLVLLNNDTAPHNLWLEKLVRVAQEYPQVGIVTGHLHLFYDNLNLDLEVDAYKPKNDDRELGVQIFGVDCQTQFGVTQYLCGFHGWEVDDQGRRFRWTKSRACLGIPLPASPGDIRIRLILAAPRPENQPASCRISFQDTMLADWILKGKEPVEYELAIPERVRSKAVRLEQNTGSIIFRSGMGRDRGTYVNNNEAFFEEDIGSYDQVEEVFAGCGASLLLKRLVLLETGGFDENFFMYYEDTDLCWRARLLGWKVLYAPDALVRHIHCGTTKEWSPSFVYFTDRNRLAMVFKNGRAGQVLWVWGAYLKTILVSGIQTILFLLRLQPAARQHFGQWLIQLRVLGTLVGWQPRLWRNRSLVQRNRRVSYQEIETWFAE